jgi:hypothetical protein
MKHYTDRRMDMVTQAALTTMDNPYDPFDDYEKWEAYDQRLGYNTAALLARVAVVSQELSVPDHLFFVDQAIDEIIKENVSGIHRKVTREVKI